MRERQSAPIPTLSKNIAADAIAWRLLVCWTGGLTRYQPTLYVRMKPTVPKRVSSYCSRLSGRWAGSLPFQAIWMEFCLLKMKSIGVSSDPDRPVSLFVFTMQIVLFRVTHNG